MMAEERRVRRRTRDGADAPPRRRPAPRGLSGAQVARRAREQLAEITGYEAQGVSELSRSEDGGWTATVELLEMSRIPPSEDLLGSYRAEFDQRGELLGYQRMRRYARGRPGENGDGGGG